MDIEKTGKFIAELRRGRGLTQQELGDIVGATNKTVSRWETGVYMPPVEVLEILSREFGVTINEIVAGRRLSDSDFRETAEKNLVDAISEPGAFGLSERIAYFRKKWLRDHVFEIAAALIFATAAAAAAWFLIRELFPLACIALGIAVWIWLYNSMAAYVEQRAFGAKKDAAGENADRGKKS